MVKQLKVKGSSPVRELAGSIVKVFEEKNSDIELRAIGASAVNQMYKAITTARGILAQRGFDLLIRPGFDEVDIAGDKKTVMIAKIIVN